MVNHSRSKAIFAAYAPLKFFLAYLAFTLAVAVWGPIEYYRFPVGKISIFMLAVMAMIAVGYIFGVKSTLRQSVPRKISDELFVRRLLNLSIAVSLAGLLISIISSVMSGDLNTDISAIGDAYLSGYEGYDRNDGQYPLEFIVYSLSLPFNFITFVFGFYYFSSLSRGKRYIIAGLAVTTLLFYVLGSGKQKQLGDILIYIFAVIALKYGVRRRRMQLKWLTSVGIIVIVGLVLFVAILSQRYDALGVGIDNINRRAISNMYFDKSHPIFLIFGMDYGLNLSLFLSYLSQGYYGLGLALDTDWKWTHFMGFSYSVSVLTSRFLGFNWEWPNTLLHQVGLTTGWGESKWHTVFTHFATDFTFPGTVILFGFFAYVYARAWISAVKYENPFSILMFSLLTMGAFFIPANNQLLHTPGALFTTLLVSFLHIWVGPRFDSAVAVAGDGAIRRPALVEHYR